MKRIVTAFLLISLVAFGENEFVEGKFFMQIGSNHPIWEIWLQDIPAGQKESAKKEFLSEISQIAYLFQKEEIYTVSMLPPEWVKNPPEDRKSQLQKKRMNDTTLYTTKDEKTAFLFEDGVVYLIPENRLDYKILLTKK